MGGDLTDPAARRLPVERTAALLAGLGMLNVGRPSSLDRAIDRAHRSAAAHRVVQLPRSPARDHRRRRPTEPGSATRRQRANRH